MNDGFTVNVAKLANEKSLTVTCTRCGLHVSVSMPATATSAEEDQVALDVKQFHLCGGGLR